MVKINERFEVPFELDIKPYVHEGLKMKKDGFINDRTLKAIYDPGNFAKGRQDEGIQRKKNIEFKYRLHSAIIHAGNAESGHYYTLVYNETKKNWTKCNDSLVDEISQEDGFKLINGGKNSAGESCAYYLMYVQKEKEKKDKRKKARRNAEGLPNFHQVIFRILLKKQNNLGNSEGREFKEIWSFTKDRKDTSGI